MRRWVSVAIALIALFVAAVAVFDPVATFPGSGDEAPGSLNCEAVLEGGRHPDVPSVERDALVECRPELQVTLETIEADRPFPYPQDNETFFNREGYLAPGSEDAYREYTVDTPGLGHRGTRRVVTHGEPAREPSAYDAAFYTDDHYDTFWRIIEP